MTHGGVFPKWLQGSRVTYNAQSLKFFFKLSALCSACGLPFIEVEPVDIILPFFSTTQPTEGFVFVEPKLILACWNANSRQFILNLLVS